MQRLLLARLRSGGARRPGREPPSGAADQPAAAVGTFRLRFQPGYTDCAAACLATSLEFHLGRSVAVEELAWMLGADEDGASVAAIVEVARQHGLRASGVRLAWRSLPALEPGSLLYWAPAHFVVLESVRRFRVHLLDPSAGPISVPRRPAPRQFGGLAVRLSASPGTA